MSRRIALAAAVALLAGCGSDAAAPGGGQGSGQVPADLNENGRALVADGCDPRVAAALQPYGVELGQCDPERMPRLTGICGAGNEEAGIALIPTAFDNDAGGQNPWAWACARQGDTRRTLVAACMKSGTRGNRTEQVCGCAADRTMTHQDRATLDHFAVLETGDTPEARRRFPDLYPLSADTTGRLNTVRNAYFENLQQCGGG